VTREAAPEEELPALHFERTFPVDRERVFRAWTDAEEIKSWLVPEGVEMTSAEVDARVGGDFRLQYRALDGSIFYAVGTFVEVEPPRRLVFTWLYEGMDIKETLVTVEIRDSSAGCELVLTHERFFNEGFRGLHDSGWGSSLRRLADVVSSSQA
jgi:uncharacterized protein YndB with AHSA1/START domain